MLKQSFVGTQNRPNRCFGVRRVGFYPTAGALRLKRRVPTLVHGACEIAWRILYGKDQ